VDSGQNVTAHGKADSRKSHSTNEHIRFHIARTDHWQIEDGLGLVQKQPHFHLTSDKFKTWSYLTNEANKLVYNW